jgi:hypothetical protein
VVILKSLVRPLPLISFTLEGQIWLSLMKSSGLELGAQDFDSNMEDNVKTMMILHD